MKTDEMASSEAKEHSSWKMNRTKPHTSSNILTPYKLLKILTLSMFWLTELLNQSFMNSIDSTSSWLLRINTYPIHKLKCVNMYKELCGELAPEDTFNS